MLKKLVPILALTSFAFGSGLYFNSYNHNYVVSTKQLQDSDNLNKNNKTIIPHNSKRQIGKKAKTNLDKYTMNGDKTIMLMRGEGEYFINNHFINEYFIVYTECMNGKPSQNYPIKLRTYRDEFWTKALMFGFQDGWYHYPGGYYCYYEIYYYPHKLIKEHKGYNEQYKDQNLPIRVLNPLTNKSGT